MDPKIPQNLDPKLKEVYERVMGTPTSAPSAQPSPAPQVPVEPTPPYTPQEPDLPPQSITQAKAETEQSSNHESSPHPFPKTSFVASQDKTTSNLMPLLIASLLIFFAAYTVFWMKFFNIPLIRLPF